MSSDQLVDISMSLLISKYLQNVQTEIFLQKVIIILEPWKKNQTEGLSCIELWDSEPVQLQYDQGVAICWYQVRIQIQSG